MNAVELWAILDRGGFVLARGLLALLWQSSILFGAAWLLAWALRRHAPEVRHRLWLGALLLAPLLPVLTWLAGLGGAPQAPVAVLPDYRPSAPSFAIEPVEPIETAAIPQTIPAPPIASFTPRSPRPSPLAFPWALLLAAYLVGVGLFAGWYALGCARIHRWIRAGAPPERRAVLDAFAEARVRLCLKRSPRLLETARISAPLTVGLFRPAVLFPTCLAGRLTHAELRDIALHELTHARRRDPLVLAVAALMRTVLYFHPLVWLASRQVCVLAEQAADDAVLNATGDPLCYAKLLSRLAEEAPRRAPLPELGAGVVLSKSAFLKRIEAILSSRRVQTQRLRRGTLAATCAGVGLSMAVALAVPLQVKASQEIPPVPASLAMRTTPETAAAPAAVETAIEPADAPTALAESGGPFRVLHFPADISLGSLLTLRKPRGAGYVLGRSNVYDEWDYLAEARGDVMVPRHKKVKLEVATQSLGRLQPLCELRPDDLYAIDVFTGMENGTPVPDTAILEPMLGLTGLQELGLASVSLSDAGLAAIGRLTSLRFLSVYSPYALDRAFPYLQGLKSLEVLHLRAPVTDDALPYIGALPSLRELFLKCDNIRGPGLEYLANNRSLEFIELNGDGLPDRALRRLEGIRSLRSLILCSSGISDGAMPYLARLTQLEELKLLHTPGITDTGMPFIEQMTNLRVLDLHSTHVTNSGLVHLQALTNLEELTLPFSSDAENAVTDAALAQAATLPRLRRLDARGWCPGDLNNPGPFTDEGLRALAQCRQLESLGIASGTGITDVGMGYLSKLEGLKRLMVMTNGVTNAGMAHLPALTSLENLELFFPYADNVTVAGVNHLNRLANLTHIHIKGVVQDYAGLNLDGLKKLDWLLLSIRGAYPNHRTSLLTDQDLAALGRLTNLRYLGVGSGPEVSDAGIAHLAGLTSLERLFVGGDKVTGEGLAKLTRLKNLYQLSISGNFTDEGLAQLATLKRLQLLSVTGPRGIGPEAEAYLRSHLPNLRQPSSRVATAGFGGG